MENIFPQGNPRSEGCLNLVIVVDSLTGGGAEQAVLRLVSALIGLGNKVRLVSINPQVSYAVDSKIEVFYLNQPTTKKGIRYFYYRRTARALQKLLDQWSKQSPIHALLSNLPECDRIVQYVTGYPTAYCIHSNLYQAYVRTRNSPIKRILKIRQLRRLYDNKHLIFVSNGAMADMLHHVGIRPASARVIYNAFPIKEICQQVDEYPVQYQNYFIHVGRFNKLKRHDKLLRMFAESEVTESLLLLGEGDAEQTSTVLGLIKQNGLEGRVVICGFNKNPFPYIHNAVALLLTSDYEGLPNVLIEALICGTPAIAYDCPSGPREILDGELKEFLISFDDSIAFVDKLRQVSRDRPRIPADSAGLIRFDEFAIAGRYIETIMYVVAQPLNLKSA